MIVECQTCGGRYAPVLPDGMDYFHQCPPVLGVLVERTDRSRVIVPLKTRTVEGTDPTTGAKTFDIQYELPAGVEGTVISEVPLERVNARNENPHPNDRDARGRAPIISEGRGVKVVAAGPVAIVGFPDAVRARTT